MKNAKLSSKKSAIKLTLIVTVAFVTTLLFLLFSDLVKSQTLKIQNSLQQESTSAEKIFTEKFSSTFLVMESINKQVLKDPKNKSYINNVVARYKDDQAFNNIFSWTLFSWTDAKGQLIVDSEYGIVKNPLDLSVRDYMPKLIQEPRKLHLGQPVFGSTSKIWMIPGGVGLLDKDGNYLGAITIGFNIEELAKIIQKSLDTSEINFRLFDEKNLPVFEITDSRLKILSQQDRDKFSTSNSSSKSHLATNNSLLSGKMILTKKLDKYPYFFVLEYSPKAMKHVFWEVFYSRIIEILLSIFGSVVLLVVIYKSEEEKRQSVLSLMQREKTANQAKTDFLLRVAHELKNFISGIKGLSFLVEENLKHDKLPSQNNIDHLQHINEISDELGTFVADLIDLHQTEDGTFEVVKSKDKIDLGDLIERSARFLNNRAKKKKISIEVKIAENLHRVSYLDPRRIKQILISLISNAIKFSPEDSSIRIIAENISEKKVLIRIRDNGIGMTDEEVEVAIKDFQPRTSEDNSKINLAELNLSILKFLITNQGGILEIDSKRNSGTEIKIIF